MQQFVAFLPPVAPVCLELLTALRGPLLEFRPYLLRLLRQSGQPCRQHLARQRLVLPGQHDGIRRATPAGHSKEECVQSASQLFVPADHQLVVIAGLDSGVS